MMTQKFDLPYGKTTISINLEDNIAANLFLPAELTSKGDEMELVNSAIRNPINIPFFSKSISNKTTVAITINDKTRPVPNNILFPPLLDELLRLGIPKENILIVIATGTHLPMPELEFSMLLKEEILSEYRIISHNCDDTSNLTYKGTTTRGTPVFVNSLYDRADIKIVVGDIEPHHFAGFSGGVKSASIGVSGRETINHNHSLLQDPKSCVGCYEENPLRQDIEEIGKLIGVDLALNAILNEKKQILHVFFGNPMEVMKAGVREIRETELTMIDQPYDLVIASAGGYPKDINLYQAQKALTHASLFCRVGGTVLLAAACNEGVGSQGYLDFMKGISSHSQVRKKLSELGFVVGPHKALQFALIADKINFMIKTDIENTIMLNLLIQKIDDLQECVEKSIRNFSTPPRIAIIPFATATIPKLCGG
jgi:lactate racemase